MKKTHIKLGEKGELIALQFLEKKGYKILETNWFYQKKEIDIIAQYEDFLIIVEVKSRKNKAFQLAEEYVNVRKQKNIIEVATNYIEKKEIDLEVRFDIIIILFDENNYKIKHIKNAFYDKV